MKKAKIPLPVLILISTTLFLFSSTLGEWIGRPTASLRTPPRDNAEQQQAAVAYVRLMSWLSQIITPSAVRAEGSRESAAPLESVKARVNEVTARRVQLCALQEFSRFSSRLCKSTHRALSRRQPSAGFRVSTCAAPAALDLGETAGGS